MRADPYFVDSLARGLRVLAAFEPTRPELTQRELAEIAGVSVPSGFRIGHTLVELGYLIRNPATKGYRLGPMSLTLGIATLASMSLPELVEPKLSALHAELNENLKLAVLQGTQVIYIARYTAPGRYTNSIQIGSRLPAAGTSIGRAILSQLPREAALEIVESTELPARTEKSNVDRAAIMSAVDRARELGYALNDQEITIEHRSAGAPIMDRAGQVVAAINVSVSANRISLEELVEDLVPPLVRTANEISELIPAGYSYLQP